MPQQSVLLHCPLSHSQWIATLAVTCKSIIQMPTSSQSSKRGGYCLVQRLTVGIPTMCPIWRLHWNCFLNIYWLGCHMVLCASGDMAGHTFLSSPTFKLVIILPCWWPILHIWASKTARTLSTIYLCLPNAMVPFSCYIAGLITDKDKHHHSHDWAMPLESSSMEWCGPGSLTLSTSLDGRSWPR